ncbi:MAG: family 16 glycoside hydrolase [Planctomycetaceae bacterium]
MSTGPQRVEETVVVGSGPPPLPPQEFASGSCRVYTTEPGWQVFVDGYPVRDEAGQPMVTPCQITTTAGSHTVSIAQPGRQDRGRIVLFAEATELVFDTIDVPEGDSQLLAAPWLDLPVGQSLPLESLNSPGGEFDPFLSADGLSLWFAAERSEGRGIYTASRPSPLYPFGAPELLRLTSSVDQPASPSIDAAGTMVVYTLPAKGRLRALTRDNPLAPFESPKILVTDDDVNARYEAAQILNEGDRLYFSREVNGVQETRVVFRQNDDEQPFQNVRIVEFPGVLPRLSSDGLRQFLFDGKRLQRARRLDTKEPFAAPEPVAEVELPAYRASGRSRQFHVSDDEQWLFYSDDPSAGGDLWVVRLSNGPAWGVPINARTIEPRAIAAVEPEVMPAEELFMPEEPMEQPELPPDPRSSPLPYVAFHEKLRELAAARDFDAAIELIDEAQADPELRSAAELIAWDQTDLQQLIQFWEDVEQGVFALQPGDKLRFGPTSVEFEKYADGVITAKARTKSVEKRLVELDAATLVTIAEKFVDISQPRQALRPLVFLEYSGDGTSSRREILLKAAAEHGALFVQRLAGRRLELARLELARENISGALRELSDLKTNYPASDAAAQADAVVAELYARTQWRTMGSRRWEQGPLGEYTAASDRSEGSALVSPEPLNDFQLSMEYRTNSPTGQGGVYFKYAGQGRLGTDLLKVQLSNDAGIKPDDFSTGALFGRSSPTRNATKPQGEWNTFELTVIDKRARVVINGQEVLDTAFSLGDNPASGYIALDGVAGGISYRKLILSDQPVAQSRPD